MLAWWISNKKVDSRATPVGGGTEAERANKQKAKVRFAPLRSAIRRDVEIVRTISTINDKHLPRELSTESAPLTLKITVNTFERNPLSETLISRTLDLPATTNADWVLASRTIRYWSWNCPDRSHWVRNPCRIPCRLERSHRAARIKKCVAQAFKWKRDYHSMKA